MAQVTQDTRPAQLQTPLGKDVLVLASFVAAEGLSELFEFNVEALSEEENINFDKAIDLLEAARDLAPQLLRQHSEHARRHLARWLAGRSELMKV